MQSFQLITDVDKVAIEAEIDAELVRVAGEVDETCSCQIVMIFQQSLELDDDLRRPELARTILHAMQRSLHSFASLRGEMVWQWVDRLDTNFCDLIDVDELHYDVL